MTNIDISPEAVERLIAGFEEFCLNEGIRLECVSQERAALRALSAALTQSRAEMAKLLAMNDAGYDTVTYRAVAAAEARGMRKAAVIAYQFEGNDKLRCAILAAIPQKDAPND